ncbi:MAG: hypothetical protein H7066_19615 [Cytophagaceae bacterium]|nr:hypothetical protein [Gemmatimonadaceae bacterium]
MTRHRAPLLLAAAFVVACGGRSEQQAASTDSAAVPADTAWTVSTTGFGPAHIGLTLAQLNTALGESLTLHDPIDPSCGHVSPRAFPAGVSLMIVDDSVARVEVDTAGVRTADGAQVGDSEQSVLALYVGRVQVMPHKYTGPEGHYLVVSAPGDTMSRIVFETDGQRVERYRAGRRPAVDYVEGCA